MGDDGEEFSSNFSKPSLESLSEQQHSIQVEILNGQQCQLAEEGMHVAVDDRSEMLAAAEAGGEGESLPAVELIAAEVGSFLEGKDVEASTEKVDCENSVSGIPDKVVVEEEHRVEVPAEQTGPLVPAEEVTASVETVDEEADATAADTEENGSFVGRSDDAVVDEAVAVVEEESRITKSGRPSTADESVTVEEPLFLMKEAEKEQDLAEDREANVEGIMKSEVKVDAETIIEEIKPENVSGLQGLEFVDSEPSELVEEDINQNGAINGVVVVPVGDMEMGDIKGMDELKSSVSHDLQCDVQESVVVVSDEANKERSLGAILTADTELEEGKEGETEEMVKQDEGRNMVTEVSVADKGMDTGTYVGNAGEERMQVGNGKENEKEVVESGDVEFVAKIDDDAERASQVEEVGEMVAEADPVLVGTEIETKTGLGEEQRLLGRGKEVETETIWFDDSISRVDDNYLVPQDDDDDEDEEMVKESALAGTGMETEVKMEAEMGEERRLIGLEEGKEAGTETVEIGDDESMPKIDDAKDVPLDEEEGDEDMIPVEESALADTEMEAETDVGESSKAMGEKHKKGRNSKILLNSKTVSKAQKIMDEDVCFICFDGGDLVLCDRRGCPKAYHPSCVNRDEAFFRSKGRWNCGWHICSICEKTAHYMCYTCPFSLCKGCTKDAVILCVRGNKGFCETCMRIAMLIENSSNGSDDAWIDFDDKNSWEFLFKDYYTDLKSKLSLTSSEIDKAKNTWKGSDVRTSKEESPEAPEVNKDGGGSGNENAASNLEGSKPKSKKAKKRSRSHVEEDAADVGIFTPGSEEWASKELLGFVMHMKHGDKSVLSQFDVQALLLEYIKRNKLRDPRRKSQIICDSRLENLFGKPRVGHFEMLKLLESHFLMKEDGHTDDAQGSVVDTEMNQLEADEIDDAVIKGMKERKRKIHKKGDRGPLSNRYDYAAIDTHNISLIYLRRKLMEDILEDNGDFQNKVKGTFVRIRIPGNTQKQEIYRLVQVVGTSKAAEPYTFGKWKTDVMLEILNLDKSETVSIDAISNQVFTEEECKRLRQSIKCGLLNRMTVGDILDKAIELQAARVNDWLESEILRLSHLRDRASDMGRRKELRECVEKLQILKTPEERIRRMEEIPKILADPKMDPNNMSEDDESETDDNRRESLLRTASSGFARRGRAPISPGSDFSRKDSWMGGSVSSKNWESNKNIPSKNLPISGEDAIHISESLNNISWNQGREKVDNKVNLSLSSRSENVGLGSNSLARSESISGVALVNSSASFPAKGAENVVKINETQKQWHYQDPSGKVQGPFSLTQLRKWSNTGYFPTDLEIWKTGEKLDESILLTDAFAGKFPKFSGDIKMSAAVTLDTAHGFPSHYGKASETLYQQSREETFGDRSNVEQNRAAQVLQMGILKGSVAPPVEIPKLSLEKWTRSGLPNLPSPTPGHSNMGETGEQRHNLLGGTSYAEGKESPASALSQRGSVSAVNVSFLNSSNQLTNGHENDFLISGTSYGRLSNSEQCVMGSANPVQTPLLTATGETRMVEDHGHHPQAQESTTSSIQSMSSQTSHIETHGWGGPPTQKVESNPQILVTGQKQAYNHWGAMAPLAQNPGGNFSNSGASALPRAEFWGAPAQSNQPNMHTQPVPNVSWGTGLAETNSAMRPENSSTGWAPVQANPNMGWVAPTPVPPNMNWGSAVQGPPGNANPGFVMGTVDAGSSMQGQIPGNVNPGWVAPPVNSGVQGMGIGGGTPGWVPPVANVGSGVQVPAPGNGWALSSGNQGAPVQGVAPGNGNQGWGAPPGNQGAWGLGQRDMGSQRGDSSYGSGRPWNRQSSFGRRGGVDLRNVPRDKLCPYNTEGRCRKGNRCNYIHS